MAQSVLGTFGRQPLGVHVIPGGQPPGRGPGGGGRGGNGPGGSVGYPVATLVGGASPPGLMGLGGLNGGLGGWPVVPGGFEVGTVGTGPGWM